MFIDQWTKIAPKHWSRKKLKHVASLRSGESITADSIMDEGDFPVYGGNGLRGYTGDYTHEGEFVLIGRQGALCGNVNYAKDRFWASEHAVVVTRLGNVDLTWLGELLRYLNLNRLSQSAAQPGISAEEVSNVLLAVPPLEEQRAISAYLKSETARLDALVAAKQRLIDLLAEKRKAIIATAVTRGLDPKVKLRDSGVPWMGEIPAHWETKRLKYLGQAIIGLTYAPADAVMDGSGVLVLRASNVQERRIVLDDNVFVTTAIPPELMTRRGDILICSRSGSRALIGKCALIDAESEAMTFGAFMTVFRGKYNSYLFHVFNSPLFEYQAGAFGTSTINQLTVETLSNMEVPLPPDGERQAIVEHIARSTAKLDSVRAAIERTIALLTERRSALIAAAVTGRLDVGAAA